MGKLMSLGLYSAAAAALLAAAPPAVQAHHSFSMFDTSKEVVLDGTVKQFRWTNPHCWIHLTVVEKGKPVEYSIESPSPSFLSRRGWSAASLKAGERVKVTINPMRDGSKGGGFVRSVFPDGRTLTLAN